MNKRKIYSLADLMIETISYVHFQYKISHCDTIAVVHRVVMSELFSRYWKMVEQLGAATLTFACDSSSRETHEHLLSCAHFHTSIQINSKYVFFFLRKGCYVTFCRLEVKNSLTMLVKWLGNKSSCSFTLKVFSHLYLEWKIITSHH